MEYRDTTITLSEFLEMFTNAPDETKNRIKMFVESSGKTSFPNMRRIVTVVKDDNRMANSERRNENE